MNDENENPTNDLVDENLNDQKNETRSNDLENSSQSEGESKQEHRVIHKKNEKLHIYVRQDKYKGELKSKNWVGRTFINGCMARKHGIDVDYYGPCKTIENFSNYKDHKIGEYIASIILIVVTILIFLLIFFRKK